METNPNLAEVKIFTERSMPATSLGGSIDFYTFRSIHLGKDEYIRKFMPCRHSCSIDFYIGDSYDTIDVHTGFKEPFVRCTIRGPRTYKKYSIELKNNFVCFSIRFKPTGIYQLLGIPMEKFRNATIDLTLINHKFNELTHRLYGCTDIQSCINIVEPFFIQLLYNRNQNPTTASRLADLIINSDPGKRLLALYGNSPVTPRQLERNFNTEIGLSPKSYSALIRFERLMQYKIQNPSRKWAGLAYEYEYFDQMHMIKDFHKFLNINPNKFRAENFAL